MMVLFDGCPDCWTKMESHQQKWDHFECSSTVIKTMPNGGKLTLEKKFFMCCRSAIFERLPKFRSLSHQHPEEHIRATPPLNTFHSFMPPLLEAYKESSIQVRFLPAFCMTRTVCHFLLWAHVELGIKGGMPKNSPVFYITVDMLPRMFVMFSSSLWDGEQVKTLM